MTNKIRKSFLSLTDAERVRFYEAILQLKKDPPVGSSRKYTYTHFVAWHRIGIPAKVSTGPIVRATPNYTNPIGWHDNLSFLSWHRAMLLLFEENLRLADKELDPGSDDKLALPYWDWTYLRSRNPQKRRGLIWTDANCGPTGNASNLVTSGYFADPSFAATGNPGWTFTDIADYLPSSYNPSDVQPGTHSGAPVYALTRNVNLFFAPQKKNAIKKILRLAPPLDIDPMNQDAGATFRNALEGFVDANGNPGGFTHNLVHGWVGGSMGLTTASPKDPVFYLHHCYVDYLWAKWQLRRTTDANANPVVLIKNQQYPSDDEVNYAQSAATGSTIANPNALYLTEGMYPWDGSAIDYKNGSVPISIVITADDILNWTKINIPSVSSSDIGYRYDDDPLAVTI